MKKDRMHRMLGGLQVVALLQGIAIAVLLLLELRAPAPAALPSERQAGASAPAAAAAAPIENPVEPSADATAPELAPAHAAPAPARAATAALFGALRDSDGKPVDEARVELQCESGPARRLLAHRGSYAFPGVAAGPFRLRVTAEGLVPAEVKDALAVPPDVHRRDVVLQRAWMLRVKIADDGGTLLSEAIAALAKDRPELRWIAVDAVATTAPPPPSFRATVHRAIDAGVGKWIGGDPIRRGGGMPIPEGYSGVLQLQKREPLFVSAVLRHLVLASVPVAAEQDDVTLTVPLARLLGQLGSVRLRCTDGTTQQPLAGIPVSLTDAQSGTRGTPTDAEGRITLRDLRPGLLQLGVSSWTPRAPSLRVLVPPGGELDLGDVVLLPPVKIGCEAVDPEGKEIEATIFFIPLGVPPHAATSWDPVLCPTGGAGQQRAQVALYPGVYLVRASNGEREFGALQEIDLRTFEGDTLRVELRPVPALSFQCATGNDAIEVEIHSSAGHALTRFTARGTHSLDVRFPAGDYTATLRWDDGRTVTKHVRLDMSGATLAIP